MELIILLVLGCIVCGIIGAVLGFIKEHIGQIVGFLLFFGILGAVLEFAPAVMSACSDAFQRVTSVVPIEVIIGIVVTIIIISVILKGVRKAVQRSRGKKLMKWLDCVGVGRIDLSADNQKTLDYLVKKNLVMVFSGNYVVSTDFGEAVQHENYYRRFISRNDMLSICIQILPTFDTDCFDVFFGLFQRNLLLLFPMERDETYYVSIDFIIECEQVFEAEGAATHTEMVSHLESAFSDSELNDYYDKLAQVVLDHLVVTKKVSVNRLDFGEDLYVSKNPVEGTKLVRREISLD